MDFYTLVGSFSPLYSKYNITCMPFDFKLLLTKLSKKHFFPQYRIAMISSGYPDHRAPIGYGFTLFAKLVHVLIYHNLYPTYNG